jgi:hypothetical protein
MGIREIGQVENDEEVGSRALMMLRWVVIWDFVRLNLKDKSEI